MSFMINTTPIESSLPRSYEHEANFQDTLYEWMQSAPWFAISAGFHLLILFVLSAFPWDAVRKEPPIIFMANLPEQIEPAVEEPPVEPPDLPEETDAEPTEEIDEPVLNEVVTDEVATSDLDSLTPFDSQFDSPFDSNMDADASNDVIGIGGPGGKIGQRKEGYDGGGNGGSTIVASVALALEWLAAHQSSSGGWDANGFNAQCGEIGDSICDGAGRAEQDTGVTGLALLAFLGIGEIPGKGQYGSTVAKAVIWLRDQQDADTGLIGDPSSQEFLYGHAIATLALCETYYATGSPLLKPACQRAVWYIQRARNPYGAWRYDVPGNGDSDTSVTGWMVFALKAAEDAGLEVDRGSFEGAMSWLDEATDMSTGRIGYNAAGSLSSRIPGVNDHYPAERGEAMTAVGLLCRVFMGQDDVREHPVLARHSDLLKRNLPTWDPDGFGNDMYYWYYGTYAMFQMGGASWKAWEPKLKAAVIDSQCKQGDAKGSWDPNGPWGFSGGRVYSTALMALTEEVYFRYGRVTGSR